MNDISQHDVLTAIDQFLQRQLETKLEPQVKKLEKATDESTTEVAQAEIDKLRTKYTKSIWIDNAANTMAKQLTFGTHISKGVHPDAKGDNVNFIAKPEREAHIVGTQLLDDTELDANGNAAALPLAAFYNIDIKGYTLRSLIQAGHRAIEGVFSDDPSVSQGYTEQFKASLEGVADTPTTNGRNKQLLWPLDKAVRDDNYRCLIPLYPSALTHEIFTKINQSRYSDENKQARENRFKKNAVQQPYVSINDLAFTLLGGTKPQNVSLLNSKQGGRHYLLPSVPPTYEQTKQFVLNKKQHSFFGSSLRYHCYLGFVNLFNAIDAPKNTVDERDQRKAALQMILEQVVILAISIQRQYSPGWSEEYALAMPEKYWLDPKRSQLPDQEKFAEDKEKTDWLEAIQSQFSLWLNTELHKKYPKRAHDFDDSEFKEWKREIEAVIKANQRAQTGAFV